MVFKGMTEIEEALIKASEIVSREGGCPEMIWHPEFGWMNLKIGEPKETIAAFYEFLGQYNKRPRDF